MSLKSFSFGLGLGIAFVSVLSLVLFRAEIKPKNENVEAVTEISDEEIIKRAKELGMISYSDLPSKKETAQNSDNDYVKVTEEAVENTTEKVVVSSENQEKSNKEMVELVIKSGSTARIVSQELYNLGVIENAEDFRLYLGSSGNSKKIMTGKYLVPKDASYEEIVNIIKDKRKKQ